MCVPIEWCCKGYVQVFVWNKILSVFPVNNSTQKSKHLKSSVRRIAWKWRFKEHTRSYDKRETELKSSLGYVSFENLEMKCKVNPKNGTE